MASYPLVLVDGPSRCGKSTVASQLASSSSAGAILARAGSPEGRRIMANPLALSAARPVILDGATLDEARALESILSAQHRTAQLTAEPIRLPRFVLVGGPFGQTKHITARLSLTPLTLAEVGRGSVRTHWLRGGYPEIYTADSDGMAMSKLENIISGLPGWLHSFRGLPDSATRLATLLSSLAEGGGSPVNESKLARKLDSSRPTICRWMGGLEQAGILRRMPRLPGKAGNRRTVKAPAWFIRDSGLAHGLLGIHSAADLRSLPRLAAASWQSYVLEQTAAVIPEGTEAGSYLSSDGACVDLVLSRGSRIIAASLRTFIPVSPGRGTTVGADAIGATDRFIVVPDTPPRDTCGGFRTIGLASFLDEASSTDEYGVSRAAEQSGDLNIFQ